MGYCPGVMTSHRKGTAGGPWFDARQQSLRIGLARASLAVRTVVALAMGACAVPHRCPDVGTAAPRVSAEPPPPDLGSTHECNLDSECQARAKEYTPDSVTLCENHRCTLYDLDTALRWAASVVPGIDQHARDRDLTPEAAPWFKEGAHARLFVRGDWLNQRSSPAACTSIDFVAREGALFADVDSRGRTAPRFGCSMELILDSTDTLYDGGCRTPEYASSSGGLSPNTFRRYGLTSVDERALVYDGEQVTLTPFCRWSFVDRPGCREASCRTCDLDIAVRYVAGGGGLGSIDSHTTVANSTCGPCLPDTQERRLPRLVAILQGRFFLQTTEEKGALRFYRDQRDCDAYVHGTRATGGAPAK
jgi:hypothetical protein